MVVVVVVHIEYVKLKHRSKITGKGHRNLYLDKTCALTSKWSVSLPLDFFK